MKLGNIWMMMVSLILGLIVTSQFNLVATLTSEADDDSAEAVSSSEEGEDGEEHVSEIIVDDENVFSGTDKSTPMSGRSLSNHEKLFNHLFGSCRKDKTKYNRFVIPVDVEVRDEKGQVSPSSGPVQAQFGVSAIYLDLTPSGILKGTLWHRSSYYDPRLTFKPDEFGGVSQLNVDASLLWAPDIILYNSADRLNEQKAMFNTQSGEISNGIIYPDGKILIVPEVHISAFCGDSNLADFWGEQKCTLKFGSWTYSANMINLTVFENQDEMEVEEYIENISPLEILSNKASVVTKYYPCCPDEPYISINYELTLKRRFMITHDGKYISNPSQ